jgi:hypothetical protein
MSAVSDFLTEPSFWWGGLAGTIVTGIIAPLIAARSVRASDRRKAAQEDALDAKKAEREDLRSNRQILREASFKFTDVCSSIIEKAVDAKGIFNSVMDVMHDMEGRFDKRAVEKVEYAVDLVDEMKKVTTAYNNLRQVAPTAVLEKAAKLSAAILYICDTTTMPLKKPPLMTAAADAFEEYTNAVRAELGLDPFTGEDGNRARESYLEVVTKHINAYVEEAREDYRRNGFLEPGSVEVTSLVAGDLTEDHVGKFLGFHEPRTGVNYGAKILEVKRDDSHRYPGMLVKVRHSAIPGLTGARDERMRLKFDEPVELVKVPTE